MATTGRGRKRKAGGAEIGVASNAKHLIAEEERNPTICDIDDIKAKAKEKLAGEEYSSSSKTQRKKKDAVNLDIPAAGVYGDSSMITTTKKAKRKKALPDDEDADPEERRLRRYRPKPPQSYSEIYARAASQRMFVIDRLRGGNEECPNETMTIAGTTGNLYTVKINLIPSCNCPHANKGNQCKHIIYAMVRVLRAPTELQYQLALLKSELRIIFANAPPIPSMEDENAEEEEHPGRKPVEGDCPICFMPLASEDGDPIVFCKAACGNNFHQDCLNHWAASKRASSAKVTCPLCRNIWVGDEYSLKALKNLGTQGSINDEGYVNVAAELGLDGERDYSTYHLLWVRSVQRQS